MADPTPNDPMAEPEIRKTSDRLMVILGQAMLDEIEKAQNDGENMVAWQFGALDALTKQLSGAITAAATMVKGMTLTQQDFVVFRNRVHHGWSPPSSRCSTPSWRRSGPAIQLPGHPPNRKVGTPENGRCRAVRRQRVRPIRGSA